MSLQSKMLLVRLMINFWACLEIFSVDGFMSHHASWWQFKIMKWRYFSPSPGHGTIGLEIMDDLPQVDTVICPYGSGGLIAGVASAIKSTNPNVRILACEPETASPLKYSKEQGGFLWMATANMQTLLWVVYSLNFLFNERTTAICDELAPGRQQGAGRVVPYFRLFKW